ncbi:hypothetical protein [uncultured Roseovarius sp.]|uniref:hypothetical protein n=1 Tax=uncultured Roseovarius sp. TaxID=293344 RepID=UPI002623A140|nr:hypothetical protein [uncultured Roseovarius sp.]
MVDIFSKNDGPRREDVEAKRLLQGNMGTIHKLADQISNGEFSRSRAAMAKAKQEPKAEGLNIHILGGASKASEPSPVVRVSIDERVMIMDANSGKQMIFLGQLRLKDRVKFFVLATKENGFVSPLDPDIQTKLQDLNGIVIENEAIKEKFATVISERLGL